MPVAPCRRPGALYFVLAAVGVFTCSLRGVGAAPRDPRRSPSLLAVAFRLVHSRSAAARRSMGVLLADVISILPCRPFPPFHDGGCRNAPRLERRPADREIVLAAYAPPGCGLARIAAVRKRERRGELRPRTTLLERSSPLSGGVSDGGWGFLVEHSHGQHDYRGAAIAMDRLARRSERHIRDRYALPYALGIDHRGRCCLRHRSVDPLAYASAIVRLPIADIEASIARWSRCGARGDGVIYAVLLDAVVGVAPPRQRAISGCGVLATLVAVSSPPPVKRRQTARPAVLSRSIDDAAPCWGLRAI